MSGTPITFSKLLGFWVPRRFVTTSGIDVDAFVADVNKNIVERGFVMADRQVLTTPLDPAEQIDTLFEADSLSSPLETPPRVQWGPDQQHYFGLADPYQMADESDSFTWASVTTRAVVPYLHPQERILAVLHGETDQQYFYCPCHYATVVYTTAKRLVCMTCGATHLVLREPLTAPQGARLSADEWRDFFDEDGPRRHEELELPTVDFCAIENADPIWTTSQWEEAVSDFILFARSTPDEIEEAVRGTELDPSIPSILMEQGWVQAYQPPPPALQLAEQGVDVDLVQNAEHAFRDGVEAFLAAYTSPNRLLTAVPQLARAAELLLKARLEIADANGLNDRPNNPTVLRRLREEGVAVNDDDEAMVTRLRRLRNDLQHTGASFNYRAGLMMCQRSIVWLDRFADEQLGVWIGDVIRGADWKALLGIEEVAQRAERIADERIAPFLRDPEASITACPHCGRRTLVRPDPSSGARCAYCDHVPVVRDAESPMAEDLDDV